MSDDLYQALAAAAKRDSRSITQEVVAILRDRLVTHSLNGRAQMPMDSYVVAAETLRKAPEDSTDSEFDALPPGPQKRRAALTFIDKMHAEGKWLIPREVRERCAREAREELDARADRTLERLEELNNAGS
jgi:hypothetical protein